MIKNCTATPVFIRTENLLIQIENTLLLSDILQNDQCKNGRERFFEGTSTILFQIGFRKSFIRLKITKKIIDFKTVYRLPAEVIEIVQKRNLPDDIENIVNVYFAQKRPRSRLLVCRVNFYEPFSVFSRRNRKRLGQVRLRLVGIQREIR